MNEKPWIATYWRWYRKYRKWGFSRSFARKIAGKAASNWWKYMKLHEEREE